MTKSRWQQYKEKNGMTPLDLLNPHTKRVEASVAEQRFDTCKGCPAFIKISGQCKECGCFMSAKTKYEIAKCPLGKW